MRKIDIIILHIYELLLFFSHQVMSDCDPMDCSPQGSSLHEVPHPRILEQVATFFSRASSWPRDWTCFGRQIKFLWGFKTGFLFWDGLKKVDVFQHYSVLRDKTSLVIQWLRIYLPMQEGYRFDLWSGKIPHAIGQQAQGSQLLSLCAAPTEVCAP